MAPNPEGDGFVALGKDGSLWRIERPTRQRKTFVPHPLQPAGTAESLIQAGKGVVVKGTNGVLSRLRTGPDGLPLLEPIPLPNGSRKPILPGQLVSNTSGADAPIVRKFLAVSPPIVSNAPAQRPAGPRALKDLITYEQLEALLKNSLTRVPDRPPTLEGRALRGLLRWLHGQLQTMTPEEISKLPIPPLSDLRGTSLPAPPWSPAKTGGPTIDGASVGGWAIDDPMNGLRHYYEGKLVFHPVAAAASRAEHVLSFLCLQKELPELVATPESLETIRKSTFSPPAPGDARIAELLVSLYRDNGYNAAETVAELKRVNLLQPLASSGVTIPAEAHASVGSPGDWTGKVTLDDMAAVETLLATTGADVKKIFLPTAKTPRDFLHVLEPRGAGDAYRLFLDGVIDASLPAFIASGPTLDEVMQLESSCVTAGCHLKLRRHALSLTATVDEYLRVMDFRGSDGLVKETAAKFVSLKPTLDQVLDVKRRHARTPEAAIQLKYEAFRLVKSADEFLRLADYEAAPPDREYVRAMEELMSHRHAMFAALGPTKEEARAFANRYLPPSAREDFLSRKPRAGLTFGERCGKYFRGFVPACLRSSPLVQRIVARFSAM